MVKKWPTPMDAARVRLLEEERRREERIKLAIAKGKQTVLPTQTKSVKLSKFEHCSAEGPLVVFAEELAYPFGYFGNYQAVRKYQSGYDIAKDYSKSKKNSKREKGRNITKGKSGLMLNEKSENTANGLNEKSISELHDPSQMELKLPRLKSGPISADFHEENGAASKLEFSKNTELPKLPAQEYIDNFRRDAAEFERSLIGVGRGNVERRLLKGKPRENVLPRIDERGTLPTTNAEKSLAKDEHFRLPRLQQKREDMSSMESSKKKRKTKNNTEAKKHDSRRSMSHSERKIAAQKEQAKWCKMAMQSNAYI